MTSPRRGKAALFSQEPAPFGEPEAVHGGSRERPARGAGTGRPRPRATAANGGRQQMFTGTGAGRTWAVACRSCRAETPVTGGDLVRRLLRPGSLWWPLARHANRIRCPACGDTTWCRVRWRRPRRSD